MKVQIKCKGAATIDFEKIVDFQAGLKEMEPQDFDRLRNEITTRGFNSPIHVWKKGAKLYNLDGHQRVFVLKKLKDEGWQVPPVPVDYIFAKDWAEAKRILLSRISQYGKVKPEGFQSYIENASINLDEVKQHFSIPEFDIAKFEHEFYLRGSQKSAEGIADQEHEKLVDKFIVPPFSVLDARQGYWQTRKRAWLSLGIQSELGREAPSGDSYSRVSRSEKAKSFGKNSFQDLTLRKNKTEAGNKILAAGDTASVFDPVLCELAYRWFCPKDGNVLDPFAGGSVRGIVAHKLGRNYTGIDLRKEQIGANEKQAQEISPSSLPRWICGDSRQVDKHYKTKCDLVFSCPPYGDLEVYSDDPLDISTLSYEEFLDAYRQIVRAVCKKLKDNRFACFVVGDFRDQNGVLRNFVSETARAFLDAGLSLYNECILVMAVGSASIRASFHFPRGRKLEKTHQNVLVFLKGDPKKAQEACGEIEVELPDGLRTKLEASENQSEVS